MEAKETIAGMPRYLACSRVTKRPLFAFVCSNVRPGDALQAFALADDYSFGVLQSNAHYQWFHAKCSNMKSDPRYTSESVFQTFPWPQAPSSAQVDAVAFAARELRRVRADAAKNHGTGLRVLYRTLDLPGKNPLKDAHAALDESVLQAFGFSSKKDLLTQVWDLNLVVASRIGTGKAVAGPGVPTTYKNPAVLVSSDCFGL